MLDSGRTSDLRLRRPLGTQSAGTSWSRAGEIHAGSGLQHLGDRLENFEDGLVVGVGFVFEDGFAAGAGATIVYIADDIRVAQRLSLPQQLTSVPTRPIQRLRSALQTIVRPELSPAHRGDKG